MIKKTEKDVRALRKQFKDAKSKLHSITLQDILKRDQEAAAQAEEKQKALQQIEQELQTASKAAEAATIAQMIAEENKVTFLNERGK